MNKILGIDVGGSGIKGALVDVDTGTMLTERLRIETPQPATPTAVIDVINQIVTHFEYSGAIGIGFPAVVRHGIVLSAANVDNGWINFPAVDAIQRITGLPTTMLNDADVAGIAEMRFGAGRNHQDKNVMVFTLGTGIGSCMFVNGTLVPNLEIGHLALYGITPDVEKWAASSVYTNEGLSWKKWGKRLTTYFRTIEALFSPDLLIIGGGVSSEFKKFAKHIKIDTPILPAEMRNHAGIIGAALSAA
jgi:polyphosphate glucokinase